MPRRSCLLMFSSLAGRVLMGFLADLINRKYVMILIYLIVACTIPLLLLPTFPAGSTFAIIFGIGLGGDYMIIPLMAADLFGIRALGRTMGIILVADGVANHSFRCWTGIFMMWLPKVMHPDLFSDWLGFAWGADCGFSAEDEERKVKRETAKRRNGGGDWAKGRWGEWNSRIL